jgi:beta-lactamase class D
MTWIYVLNLSCPPSAATTTRYVRQLRYYNLDYAQQKFRYWLERYPNCDVWLQKT